MVGRERFSDIVGQVDRAARPSRAARRHPGYRNVVKATPRLSTPAAATENANELADEIEASFQARAHRGRLHISIGTLTDYLSNGRFAPCVPPGLDHVSVIGSPGTAKAFAKTEAFPPPRNAPRLTDPTTNAVHRARSVAAREIRLEPAASFGRRPDSDFHSNANPPV
jgi:hypothetical protein